MYLLSDYNYIFPQELIAQVPASPRDESRLMVLEKNRQRISHRHFVDIARLLSPGDVLVINNTGVVPARLVGRKESGGRVEVLLQACPGATCAKQRVALENQVWTKARRHDRSESTEKFTCQCLVKTSKRPRVGSEFHFDGSLRAIVLGATDGLFELEFRFKGDLHKLLDRIGETPLPPYIRRHHGKPPPCDDRACYQTVYAENMGAVAAPTAGLHFSDELLDKLTNKGVEIVPVTLHVGYGTFLPVRNLDVRKHQIHSEAYELSQEAAWAINKAKDEGRRIIAVGTTAVRVLEFASDPKGRVKAGSGDCDLFIYAGFDFRVIDALITNFHLPKTTLLMLVAAFAGRDFVLNAYREAIQRKYRFYSYGDSMLIW